MKPERAPGPELQQPARVEFKVQFATPRTSQPRQPDVSPPTEAVSPKKPRGRRWGVVPSGRPSRIALLLALAHHWEQLVREEVVRDYADIARLTGLTRARVTQIMNLTLLGSDLQERILFANASSGCDWRSERCLRKVIAAPNWAQQRHLWPRAV